MKKRTKKIFKAVAAFIGIAAMVFFMIAPAFQ